MTPLCSARLREIAIAQPALALPCYPRDALPASIVHIGVGAFHRAHQAVYLDDLLRRGLTGWGIGGVGLLPSDTRTQMDLARQDRLYTVLERDADGTRARVVGALVDYLTLSQGLGPVLARLASPTTRIVSMTVTEGGYCIAPGTSLRLDVAHPDVAHDLARPDAPRGLYGVLAAALAMRRARGLAPFTCMSCDNLQGNGRVLEAMLLEYCDMVSPGLGAWLREHGSFPNTMVDRITPVTTAADRDRVASAFAVDDACPVVCEPFRQWVVEDRFSDGRPPWEDCGVQLTADVEPYERLKLRLLNASHAALAYLAALAGHTLVHEAMAEPRFARFLRELMAREVSPLLPPAAGIDVQDYREAVLRRFANPAVHDHIARLCAFGSDRQPEFIVPSIREASDAGRPFDLLLLASASWCHYLRGRADDGVSLAVVDARREELTALARAPDGGRSLLADPAVFGSLGENPAVAKRYAELLALLESRGARGALDEILAT